MDKRIKTPMIIGIILQGLALVIAGGCSLMQESMASMQNFKIGEKIFPDTLVTIAIIFLLHIIALLVMQTYEGESRRLIGGILAAAYCVVNIASPIISRITVIFESRKGVEFVAAKNVLSSTISLFTSPLNLVSLMLVVIAVGRYGVMDREQT